MSRLIRSIRRAMLVMACLFAALLWARSYVTADWFWYRTGATTPGLRSVAVASSHGSITFSVARASGRAVAPDPIEDVGFTHDRMEASDLLIDPVPPDMRLVAGFGLMSEHPQPDEIAPVTWRFVVFPWWSVTALAAAALFGPKMAAHVKAFSQRTYASTSNLLSSLAAFMKRTSPKTARVGPNGESCSPNSQATLA